MNFALLLLFTLFVIENVIGLSQEQENHFLADYCVARHFKSVTLIHSDPLESEKVQFFALIQQLNAKGIRFAVENEVGAFHFASFALYVMKLRTFGAFYNLLRKHGSEITASGKHWLLLVKISEVGDLKAAMTNYTINLNSDVIIAISHSNLIELQEVYTSGGNQNQFNTLGTWKSDKNIDEKLDLFGFRIFKLRRRQNLRGFEINLSSVNINPQYTIIEDDANKKKTLVGGYVGNMINSLQSQLNFKYAVKILDGYAYGLFYPENKTWTGLMGDLQQGVADMTGCEISIAENRLEYADFSVPIQLIGRRIHYKRPDRQFNWDAFLKPFSPSIWITLTLTLPLAAFVTFWLSKLSPNKIQTKIENQETFGSDLFGVISALSMQGWTGNFGGVSRRLFIWIIFVCYMIVSLSYSAKMVAMRTVEKPELPINSLGDVLERSDWEFGFIGKALERGIFEFSAPDTLLGMIWRKKVVPNMHKNLVADSKEGLEKAFANKFVFMCNHLHCSKILQTDFGPEKTCQIQVLSEDYFLGGLALGFKRNSTIREFIDHRLLLMKEAGIMDVELQHAMPKPNVCESDNFSKINILDVAPALILLVFGMGLALSALTFEIVWHWRNQQVNCDRDIINNSYFYFNELQKMYPTKNVIKSTK